MGHVSNPVKKAVVKALFNLPSRSSWVEPAGYYAWTAPMSYLPVQRLMEETGHLNGRGARACTRSESLFDNVHCPSGTYKLFKSDFYNSCKHANISCSSGQECICRPCRDLPPYPVEITPLYANGTVAGANCKKMQVCTSVRQRSSFGYRLVNLMHALHRSECLPNVTEPWFRYKFRGQVRAGVGLGGGKRGGVCLATAYVLGSKVFPLRGPRFSFGRGPAAVFDPPSPAAPRRRCTFRRGRWMANSLTSAWESGSALQTRAPRRPRFSSLQWPWATFSWR